MGALQIYIDDDDGGGGGLRPGSLLPVIRPRLASFPRCRAAVRSCIYNLSWNESNLSLYSSRRRDMKEI